MIRFVDLRPAEIAGVRFAFWDTVVDRFFEDEDGGQGWEDWGELIDSMPRDWHASDQEKRLWGLCPRWVIAT